MIFTELIVENFGAYAGKNIINLSTKTEENHRPIVLFGGMNGGGKTTLIDAIRLALYGQRAQCSTRGNLSYSDFLSQSVNHQTSPIDNTRIELAFEHIVEGQWKELRIVRTWTKNPKDGKDNLGILDEDWPDSALANTWDEYIENILPLGISNLFLFDGEQVKELAEQDTPPPTVIDAIQSLLGLELAEKLSVDLDILASRKRKDLATESQKANIDEIEAKLKQLNEDDAVAKQELDSRQNELKIAQEKYRDAANKFRLEGGKIAADRTQLKAQIENLEATTETQRQWMRDRAAEILPLNLITPLLKQAQIQGKKELKTQQAKIARDVLQERDDRLLNYLVALSLTPEQIDLIKGFLAKEYQNLDRDIETDDKPRLGVDAEELKQLENILENLLPMQVKQGEEQRKKLQDLEEEIDSTQRQLAVAAPPEAYEQLDKALQKAQQELVNRKAAFEASQRRCEEINKQIEKTKKELKEYSENAIDIENKKHIINSMAKVQQTLQLFREKLTLKKLNKLEGEVTECFRYLLHKSDLVHRVAIATETFRISLYDPQGLPLPKHRLSAGEKQLLAIAFLWGLARVSGRNLPIAIDTPLGRLDSSHRNNLVERYFPSASHQVILLSTDTEIGKKEVQLLREQEAIAREYLLQYDNGKRQTSIESGYFW
ncbi:MAG: DNA sulfur modification protein DndD [Prochloraceae cyanobacterium]|nr:DNA sulfur modification protein DndD [Prochloraceae cyanobacterium]